MWGASRINKFNTRANAKHANLISDFIYNLNCIIFFSALIDTREGTGRKKKSIDKTVQSITEVRAGNNNRSSVAIYRQHTPQAHCVLVCLPSLSLSLSLYVCLCLRLPLTDSHKYEGHKEKQSGKNYVLHMPMTTTAPRDPRPTTYLPTLIAHCQRRPSSIDITNCGICFCACTLPGQRLMECLKCLQFRFVPSRLLCHFTWTVHSGVSKWAWRGRLSLLNSFT